MHVKYIKLDQDGIVMYLLKLGVENLINNSIIERYDSSDDTGYQRQPIPGHYKKIAKYFMETNKAILPTAILAAISPEHVKEVDSNILDLKDKIRIVDGQHRIKGLEALKDGYTTNSMERYISLKENYEFPIILMSIPPDGDLGVSILEVNAFININNKGKKVNTNLAKELIEQSHRRRHINEKEYVSFNDELVSTTATRIIRDLSDTYESLWYQNIILGDDVDNKKPISINAFSKAIKPIVYQCLRGTQTQDIISANTLDLEENIILHFIDTAWNIVIEKWPECFTKEKKYNNSYNICKGIGVFPIYGLLSEFLEKNLIDKTASLKQFRECIFASRVVSSDWLVGGRFTGLTSGQAIKQVIRVIKNEIETPFQGR